MGKIIRFKDINYDTGLKDSDGKRIFVPLSIDAKLVPTKEVEKDIIDAIKYLPDFLQNKELMVDAASLLNFTLNNTDNDILKDIHTAFCDITYKSQAYSELSTEAKLEVLKENGYQYMVDLLVHMYDLEYQNNTNTIENITKAKEDSISRLLMLFNLLYVLKGTTVGLELALHICNVPGVTYITWDTIARKRGIIKISKKHDVSDGVSYVGTDKDDIKCEYFYTCNKRGFSFEDDLYTTYGIKTENESLDKQKLYEIAKDTTYSMGCLIDGKKKCDLCPCSTCVSYNCEECKIKVPYEEREVRYFSPEEMDYLLKYVPNVSLKLPYHVIDEHDNSQTETFYKPKKGDYWEIQQTDSNASTYIIFNGSSFNVLKMNEEAIQANYGKERERFTAELSLNVDTDRDDELVKDLFVKVVAFAKQYMLPWINIKFNSLNSVFKPLYCYPSGSHLLRRGSSHINYYDENIHIRENLYHALSNESFGASNRKIKEVVLGVPEYEGSGFTGTIDLRNSYVETEKGEKHYLYTNDVIVPDYITGTAIGEKEITPNSVTIKDFFKEKERINNIIALDEEYRQKAYSIFLDAQIIVPEECHFHDYYFKTEDDSWHTEREDMGSGLVVQPSDLIRLYNDEIADDWTLGTEGDDELEVDVTEYGTVSGGLGKDKIVKKNGKLIYYFAEENFGEDTIEGANSDDWIKFCNSTYQFTGHKFSSLVFRREESDLIITAPTYEEKGLPKNTKIDKETATIPKFDGTYIGSSLTNGTILFDFETGDETYGIHAVEKEDGTTDYVGEDKDQYIIAKIHSDGGYKENDIFGPSIYKDIVVEPGRKTKVYVSGHNHLEFDTTEPQVREEVGKEVYNIIFNGTAYDNKAQNIINDIGILGSNKYFIFNGNLYYNYIYTNRFGEEDYDFYQVGNSSGWTDVGASSPIDEEYTTPAICNGLLYSIYDGKETLIETPDVETWTHVTGYCRLKHTAFAIGDGKLFALNMKTTRELVEEEDTDIENWEVNTTQTIEYKLLDNPTDLYNWEVSYNNNQKDLSLIESELTELNNQLIVYEDLNTDSAMIRAEELRVQIDELEIRKNEIENAIYELELYKPTGWTYIIGIEYDSTYEGFGIKDEVLYRLSSDFSNETHEIKLTEVEEQELIVEKEVEDDNTISLSYTNLFGIEENLIVSERNNNGMSNVYLKFNDQELTFETEEEKGKNNFIYTVKTLSEEIKINYINNVAQHIDISSNGCDIHMSLLYGEVVGTIKESAKIVGWQSDLSTLSKYLHKNSNYISYGICNGILYYFNNDKVGYLMEDGNYSYGWSSVCGYYNDKSPRTFGYAIRDKKLYELRGLEVVLRDDTREWLTISGCAINSKTFALGIAKDEDNKTYLYGFNASKLQKLNGMSGWVNVYGRVSYAKEDIHNAYGYGVTEKGQVVVFDKGGSKQEVSTDNFGGSLINGCWTLDGSKITLADFNIENLVYHPVITLPDGTTVPKTDENNEFITIEGEENIRNYILTHADEIEDFREFNFVVTYQTTGFDDNTHYQIEAKITDESYEYLYPENKTGLSLNNCKFNDRTGCVEGFAVVEGESTGGLIIEGSGDLIYDVASYMSLPIKTHEITTTTFDDVIIDTYDLEPVGCTISLTFNPNFEGESLDGQPIPLETLKPIITSIDGVTGIYYGYNNGAYGVFKKLNDIVTCLKEYEGETKLSIVTSKISLHNYSISFDDVESTIEDFYPVFIGREKISETKDNLSRATYHLNESSIISPVYENTMRPNIEVGVLAKLNNGDIIRIDEVFTEGEHINTFTCTSLITGKHEAYTPNARIMSGVIYGTVENMLYTNGNYITITTDYYNTTVRLRNKDYQTIQKVVDINDGEVELYQDKIYSTMTTELIGIDGKADFEVTKNTYNYNNLRLGEQEGSSYLELVYDGEYALDTTKAIEQGNIRELSNFNENGLASNFDEENNIGINIKNLKDPLVLNIKPRLINEDTSKIEIYRDDEFTIYNKDNVSIKSNIYDVIETADRVIGLFAVDINEVEPPESDFDDSVVTIMNKHKDIYPLFDSPEARTTLDIEVPSRLILDAREYILIYFGLEPEATELEPKIIEVNLPIINDDPNIMIGDYLIISINGENQVEENSAYYNVDEDIIIPIETFKIAKPNPAGELEEDTLYTEYTIFYVHQNKYQADATEDNKHMKPGDANVYNGWYEIIYEDADVEYKAPMIYLPEDTIIPEEEVPEEEIVEPTFTVVGDYLLFMEQDKTKHYFRLQEMSFGKYYGENASRIMFNYLPPEELEGRVYAIEDKDLLYRHIRKEYEPNILLETEEDKLYLNKPILHSTISGTYNGVRMLDLDEISENEVVTDNGRVLPSGDIFELYTDYPQTIVKELIYNNIFEVDETKLYGFGEDSFDNYTAKLSNIGTANTKKSAIVPLPARFNLDFGLYINEAEDISHLGEGEGCSKTEFNPTTLVLKDCNVDKNGNPITFNAMNFGDEVVALSEDYVINRTTYVKFQVEKIGSGLDTSKICMSDNQNPPTGEQKDKLQIIDGVADRFNKFNQLFIPVETYEETFFAEIDRDEDGFPIYEEQTREVTNSVSRNWSGAVFKFIGSDDNSIKQGLMNFSNGYSLYILDHVIWVKEPSGSTYNTGYMVENNEEFKIGLLNLYTEVDYQYIDYADTVEVDGDGGDATSSTGSDIMSLTPEKEENTYHINAITDKIIDINYRTKLVQDNEDTTLYSFEVDQNPALSIGGEVSNLPVNDSTTNNTDTDDNNDGEGSDIYYHDRLTKFRIYIYDEIIEDWVDLLEQRDVTDNTIINTDELMITIGYAETNTDAVPFNGKLNLLESYYQLDSGESDIVTRKLTDNYFYKMSQRINVWQGKTPEVNIDNWGIVATVEPAKILNEVVIGKLFTGYIDCYESNLLKSKELTWMEKRTPIRQEIISALKDAEGVREVTTNINGVDVTETVNNFDENAHDFPFDITSYGVHLKKDFVPQRWDKIKVTYNTVDKGVYITEDARVYLDFICEEDVNTGRFIVNKIGKPRLLKGIASNFAYTQTKMNCFTYDLRDSDEYMVLKVKGSEGVVLGHDIPNKEALFINKGLLKSYNEGMVYNLNIDATNGVYVKVYNQPENIEYSFDGETWLSTNISLDLNSYADANTTIGCGYLGERPLALDGTINLNESYVKNTDRYYMFKRYTKINPVLSLDGETYENMTFEPMLSSQEFVTFGSGFKGSLDLYRSKLLLDNTTRWVTSCINVVDNGTVINTVYRYPTNEMRSALLFDRENVTLEIINNIPVKLSDFDIEINGKPNKGDKIRLNFLEKYFLGQPNTDYELSVKYKGDYVYITTNRASDSEFSADEEQLLYYTDNKNITLNIGYDFKGEIVLYKSNRGESVLCDYLSWNNYDLIYRRYNTNLNRFEADIVLQSFILNNKWNTYMSMGYDFQGTMNLLTSYVKTDKVSSAFADYFNNDYIIPVGRDLIINKSGIAYNFSGENYIKLKDIAYTTNNKIVIALKASGVNINQGVCSGIVVKNNNFVEADNLNNRLLRYVPNRDYSITYTIDKNGGISYNCIPCFYADYIPKPLEAKNIIIIPMTKEHTGRYIDTGKSLMEILSAPKYFNDSSNIVIEYRNKFGTSNKWVTASTYVADEIEYFGEILNNVVVAEITAGFYFDNFGNSIPASKDVNFYVGDILEYRVGVIEDEENEVKTYKTNYTELYRDTIIKQDVTA